MDLQMLPCGVVPVRLWKNAHHDESRDLAEIRNQTDTPVRFVTAPPQTPNLR